MFRGCKRGFDPDFSVFLAEIMTAVQVSEQRKQSRLFLGFCVKFKDKFFHVFRWKTGFILQVFSVFLCSVRRAFAMLSPTSGYEL